MVSDATIKMQQNSGFLLQTSDQSWEQQNGAVAVTQFNPEISIFNLEHKDLFENNVLSKLRHLM